MIINPYAFGVSGPSDPYFSSVSLLLYGNGANGGTSFTDSSGSHKTVTGFGNAQTSTGQSVYGGSSILLDGTGDYLLTAQDAGFDFGTGDFTVEAYVRYSDVSSDKFVISYVDPGSVGLSTLAFVFNINGTPKKNSFAFYSGVTAYGIASTTTVVANTWYYVAVTRTANTLRIFVDGVLEGTLGSAGASVNAPTSRSLVVGKYINADTKYLTGNVSMVRITKGVARWTATYTPETLPFPSF